MTNKEKLLLQHEVNVVKARHEKDFPEHNLEEYVCYSNQGKEIVEKEAK